MASSIFDEAQFAVFKELLPYWAGFRKNTRIPSDKRIPGQSNKCCIINCVVVIFYFFLILIIIIIIIFFFFFFFIIIITIFFFFFFFLIIIISIISIISIITSSSFFCVIVCYCWCTNIFYYKNIIAVINSNFAIYHYKKDESNMCQCFWFFMHFCHSRREKCFI